MILSATSRNKNNEWSASPRPTNIFSGRLFGRERSCHDSLEASWQRLGAALYIWWILWHERVSIDCHETNISEITMCDSTTCSDRTVWRLIKLQLLIDWFKASSKEYRESLFNCSLLAGHGSSLCLKVPPCRSSLVALLTRTVWPRNWTKP